jgi:NAD(P)-dependent dehydrogenase (short-subunit alcohol dehydrogenase family)
MACTFQSNALTVFITGANRGIGLALAKHFNQGGYNVIGSVRQLTKENPDLGELSQVSVGIVPLEVTSETSIQDLPAHIQRYAPHLDVVINNAGYLVKDTLDSMNPTSMLDHFKINTMGPLLVSRALIPLLQKSPFKSDRIRSSKVIQITSRMGSIEDNSSGGYYAYRASKCALNMINKSLAVDVKDITFLAVHPGFV